MARVAAYENRFTSVVAVVVVKQEHFFPREAVCGWCMNRVISVKWL